MFGSALYLYSLATGLGKYLDAHIWTSVDISALLIKQLPLQLSFRTYLEGASAKAAADGEWKSAFKRLKSLYGQTIARRN